MKQAKRTNTNRRVELKEFLTGILLGSMAGYGAMLLIAPQSGKMTRSQILRKGGEMQDSAGETFFDLAPRKQEILLENREN